MREMLAGGWVVIQEKIISRYISSDISNIAIHFSRHIGHIDISLSICHPQVGGDQNATIVDGADDPFKSKLADRCVRTQVRNSLNQDSNTYTALSSTYFALLQTIYFHLLQFFYRTGICQGTESLPDIVKICNPYTNDN